MCVHRDTGAQRAVKVLRKSHMDEDEKKMLFNEINILRELVSPSIRADMPYLFYYFLLYIWRILLILELSIYLTTSSRTTQILSRCTSSLRMRRDTTLLQSTLLLFNTTHRICKGGELFDEIIARGKFTEKDAAVLMKQVLSCVNYCHQNHIVHRYSHFILITL